MQSMALTTRRQSAGLLQSLRRGAQQRPRERDEDRRRQAFAGGIGDDEAEPIGREQKEIIEIAAHFLGGDHSGVQIEFGAIGKGRKILRQAGELQIGGEVPFGLLGRRLVARAQDIEHQLELEAAVADQFSRQLLAVMQAIHERCKRRDRVAAVSFECAKRGRAFGFVEQPGQPVRRADAGDHCHS